MYPNKHKFVNDYLNDFQSNKDLKIRQNKIKYEVIEKKLTQYGVILHNYTDS